MAVNPVNSTNFINSSTSSSNVFGGQDVASSFLSYFNNELEKANALQLESDAATKDIISGKSDNLSDAMIIGSKAEIALQFVLQIRNKVMDAYNEIMRMPI